MKIFVTLFLSFIPLVLFAADLNSELLLKYGNSIPHAQGEHLWGVYNKFRANGKEIALTLDACGGKNGSNVDMELLNYLIDNNIKVTIFLNYRWINHNIPTLKKILTHSNFEIANHGTEHRPLFVHSSVIYGISSTKNVEEVLIEVETAGKLIEELSGKKSKYFRSGTAYYDDVALSILSDLGYKAIGYTITADKGATLDEKEVIKRMMMVKAGDIILAHMNKPEKDTGRALIKAIPKLKALGYTFVHLPESELY